MLEMTRLEVVIQKKIIIGSLCITVYKYIINWTPSDNQNENIDKVSHYFTLPNFTNWSGRGGRVVKAAAS